MHGVQSILLYYKYVDLSGRQHEVQEWFRALCSGLQLVGRVRVARDGINVTVGGLHSKLLEHISAVKKNSLFGTDIDFKLATSSGPESERAITESHFDTLQVLLCKEVVSLGWKAPAAQQLEQTAEHLSPEQWHQMLQPQQSADQNANGPPILLDARNIYETRIGHFSSETATLVDPKLRQFSDLPEWVLGHAEQLKNRKVMMYCTGGVRCERASAFVKSLGPEFQDVYQLQGGIQRYIERFPDGGYFKGRNFVFDERVSVAPERASASETTGSCMTCNKPCYSYKPRLRCSACRLLVLVCSGCVPQVESCGILCELCRTRNHELHRAQPGSVKKLKILCLHGFRQNGDLFRKKLHKLIDQTSDLADHIFVDAPHILPFLYRPKEGKAGALPEPDTSRPKRAWMLEPSQAAASPEEKASWMLAPESIYLDQYKRQTMGWPECWRQLQGYIASNGPFDGILGYSQGAAAAALVCAELQQEQNLLTHDGTPGSCHEQRDDALSQTSRPDLLNGSNDLSMSQTECDTRETFAKGNTQTTRQFSLSCSSLSGSSMHGTGHEDGDCQQSGLSGHQSQSSCREVALLHNKADNQQTPSHDSFAEQKNCKVDGDQVRKQVKFAVICSGYLPFVPRASALRSKVSALDLYSLHLFGQEGHESKQQIPVSDSFALQKWFCQGQSQTCRQIKPHAIPADRHSIACYKSFLKQFL